MHKHLGDKMTFNEQISNIISILNCTGKELATESNITPVTLSRYINGKRIPSPESSELDGLANGISTLAKRLFSTSPDNEELKELCDVLSVKNKLISSITPRPDTKHVIENFNTLINALDINLNQLSKYIGYDSSFLYRIKTGQRKPSDIDTFITNTCNYIINNHADSSSVAHIANIIDCPQSSLADKKTFLSLLINWFSNNTKPIRQSSINNFLTGLDSFDLDEYIRTIHFDELKVPNLPFHIIHPKTYYELEGMKNAELDFYKGTVLSKSTEPIFMFSDMPMEDMAEDIEFGKKWMFAIAMSIKKGLHLNVIHNLNRPFSELLLGLESWIPLYMTGQITPYYFSGRPSSVFHQLTYVSGVCALDGQCISGHHKEGKYTLYSSKTDVQYYQKRAKAMLSKASSLMEIYYKEDGTKIKDFIESEKNNTGNFKSKLYSLPMHTINRDFLTKVLNRVSMPHLFEELWNDISWHTDIINSITSHSQLTEEVAVLSEAEFKKYTPTFLFESSSLNVEIEYTYEEYLGHIHLTEEYAQHNANYIFVKDESATFRNIQIRMKEDSWVIISKKRNPAIHFIIHHPKLINAIWNFVPLVNEN